MSGLKYWLWLTTRQGLDAAGVLTVLDYFVTPERAYYADREEYDQLPLAPKARSGLYSKELDSADRILGDCQRLSLRIMTLRDGDYPERLRQISAPPAVLYVRGKLFDFDEEAAIAVVGSRRPSQYGEMAAAKLGMELAAGGALVLSGIAEGLDTCALKGALKAGGPVVSVLGGGIDVPYPAVNRYLYEDVAAAGALISEYPPGTEPKGFHFPRRNRILSGLALGVLAVECKLHSGTMSTVRHAMDQDRDIFAIPGAIDAPMSEGTNWLIQQGAKLVTRGEDILEEYRSRFPGRLGRENRSLRRRSSSGWRTWSGRPRPLSGRRRPTRNRKRPIWSGCPALSRPTASPTTSWLFSGPWGRRVAQRTSWWNEPAFPPGGFCPRSPCSRWNGWWKRAPEGVFPPFYGWRHKKHLKFSAF